MMKLHKCSKYFRFNGENTRELYSYIELSFGVDDVTEGHQEV